MFDFDFEEMISPQLIRIFYGIGLAAIGLFGVVYLFTADGAMKLLALLGTPLVALLWRIIMEQAILFFKIYEEIQDISHNQSNSTQI